MNKKKIQWLVSSGLVATGLCGCADPCTDDGLIQSSVSECPVAPGIGASDTEAGTEADSDADSDAASDAESDAESDTFETDSNGGSDCMDGAQNGDETDVDCGGSCDEACDDGEGCDVDSDCMSEDCGDDGVCQGDDTDSGGDPACTDGAQNGDETDVDCGNSCGATCEDGEGCDDGADCLSGACDADSLTCTPAECDDGVENGDETDLDCGNSCGATCEDGEGCDDAADCVSSVCDEGALVCSAPACDDGVQNGDETDLDCGNSCGATCEDGEGCDDDADCISNVCNEVEGMCTPATCDDDVQNGDEEGIDCGGSCSDNCDPIEYCLDVDEDGFGDPDNCVTLLPHLDPPDGSVPNSDDCADDNENAFPGAAEMEPDLCAEDEDDDGWGDSNPPAGVDAGTDCVDDNADIFPGAAAGEPGLCTIDEDDDGFGDADPPAGADAGTDCVDTNPDIFPGAAVEEPDLCAIDEDNDGYGDDSPPAGADAGSDCVDTNPDIFPGAAELEPDLCTFDGDDDGFGSDSATDIDPGADNGTDCADDNANAFPGSAPNDSPTACLEDEDGDDYGDADPPDGVGAGTDCNDMDVDVPFVVDGIPDDCATAELLDGSLGCEFYGIPLANLDTSTYSVLVANANDTLTATVNIEQFVGGVWSVVAGPISLAPLEQSTEVLPENFSSTTAVTEGGSYRVVSDIPIAAYQASISQFTSDASLLIPRTSWDVEYDVVGYDGSFGEEYVAITAAEDGTEIEILPSRDTLAGGGIPAVAAGGLLTLTLDEGDTAVIMSAPQNQSVAEGLSGTIVTSTAPIGVFSGTECSNIPAGIFACDHIEEMLTPTNTAATSVIAARMPPRGTPVEAMVWEVYAVEDTTVSFEAQADVTGLPAGPVDLVAGQSLELSVGGTAANPGDFVLDATAPIIVSQYLTGATSVGTLLPGSATGDPAHVVMPGASQLLEAYVVGTVEGNVINHLTITRQSGGAAVTLDGVAVPAADFSAITAEWEVARVAVGEGTHVALSDDPFSVVVSGYNSANSYAYLGGGQARALICE